MPKYHTSPHTDQLPYHHLPTKVSEKEFNKYFRPFLSLPLRSRHPKLPLWKVFNYILYQLHTGCQWQELPIQSDPVTGGKEIHHISVWKWFNRWSSDRSFEVAFVASVQVLSDKKQLRMQRIYGDGSNSIAKKGVKTLAIQATNTRKARRWWDWLIQLHMS